MHVRKLDEINYVLTPPLSIQPPPPPPVTDGWRADIVVTVGQNFGHYKQLVLLGLIKINEDYR